MSLNQFIIQWHILFNDTLLLLNNILNLIVIKILCLWILILLLQVLLLKLLLTVCNFSFVQLIYCLNLCY